MDMLPPAARTDVPTVRLRPGQEARLHFAFRPRSVTVFRIPGRSLRLRPVASPSWQPRDGLYLITVEAVRGQAAYLVRVRLR